MINIILDIHDRKIINMAELKKAFSNLKDGKHQVSIKDARKRSNLQNAYYWSVVVPMCRQGLYDAGYDEVKTNDDAHEVLKHLFLKKQVVNKNTGETIEVDGESKKLTVPEFSVYVEHICKWAAEYMSIVIPSPNQAMIDFAEYTSQQEQMINDD